MAGDARPNDVHHLAISTRDIKQQIEFFSEVLGLELVGLFWMHGVPGAWHGFMRLHDRCFVAFVQVPGNEGVEPEIGVTHAGSGAGNSAGGTMQHLALNVDDEGRLLAMRDRIRSHGISVFGPLDHGLCKSIYFAGPEDLTLEISTSDAPMDGRAWIDPEVVALAGITAEELEAYRKPAGFASQGGRVPQPATDAERPWMRGYPFEIWKRLVEMPDEELAAQASWPEPPVKVDER